MTQDQRNLLALCLELHAEGVEEVLRDDDEREPDEQPDTYPVVEDYLGDCDRLRAGEAPIHELSWEVLREEDGARRRKHRAAGSAGAPPRSGSGPGRGEGRGHLRHRSSHLS